MMMITNPTVQVPPWDDQTAHIHSHSPFSAYYEELETTQYDDVFDDEFLKLPMDAFACDHFRMYEFKIRRCARARSHDWTECPYAHPGEKARRRDPRKFHYSGSPCPEFRKGTCHKSDTCEFAHGVFECWLHPSRYRTQPCKDGVMCRRRICFFAHTPEQLRLFPVSQGLLSQPDSYDGSPSRFSLDSFVSSPTSTLFPPATISPPMSPMSPVSPVGQTSVNELVSSVRNMQIGSGNRLLGGVNSGPGLSMLRPGFVSPTRNPTRVGGSVFEKWDVMERVESGKEIRAKMYAKLSRENSLAGRVGSGCDDDGWVSELVE